MLLILTISSLINAEPNQAFIKAIEDNDVTFVENYLNQHPGLNLEEKTENGTVALHHAETVQMVQLLLNFGANVNAQTDWGFSALHLAVSFKDHELRDLLIDQNIQIDLQDIDKRLALYNAIAVNDLDSVQLLVNRGSNCSNMDAQKVTPLTLAVSVGNYEMIDFLMKCSQDLINHQNEFGFSVLHTLALIPR